MSRKIIVVIVAVALAVAVAAGYLWGRRTSPAVPGQGSASVPRKILYWYDPMIPGQHFDHPGPSPMSPSMQLVPKYAGAGGGNEGGVRISPRLEQNLGMRTAVVRVGVLRRELRVPGVLAWDRRRSVVVSARADGVLSRLFVRAPFDRVHAGQPLAELLAPAWMSAVAEYRVLEQAHSADARGLRVAALQRLRVLGMSADEIRSADGGAGGGIVLRAPVTGVVSALEVRQGQQVSAGMTLLRIDDLTRLWLDAAIPQAEVAGVGAGTRVQVEASAFPGRVFNGRVEALLPEVDPRTRTETARIALDNPDGTLAPGMYATVRLLVTASTPYPLVPDEALISTGVQNRVILDLGDGRMAPRAVRIGRSAGGYTEVLAGLKGGERVVTSGQFLIDSEADLNGALQRLTTPPAPRSSAAPAVAASRTTPLSPRKTTEGSPQGRGRGEGPAQTKPVPMPGMAMPASTGGHAP